MQAKRALEDFVVGETAVFSRTFTESDVTQFVGITWDVNPYHTDVFLHSWYLCDILAIVGQNLP